jgi:LVIVD repeat-containing protein
MPTLIFGLGRASPMRPATPAFIALALLLAGCAGGPARTTPPGEFDPLWSERALAYGLTHNHTDPAQHRRLSTPNFEVVGYDPLLSPYFDGRTAGGYLCGDAATVADGRRIAAVESRSDVGFALADVTDAAHPKWLGELVMRSTHVYDLVVVPDGRHVVLVTSQLYQDRVVPALSSPGTRDSGLDWRTPCRPEPVPVAWAAEEDPAPRPMSVLLVDIQDPSNPTIIDQHPLAGYGHSAFSAILDGRTWVMVTTSGPQPEASAYEFYEITSTPAGARLGLLSVYKPADETDSTRSLGPRGHDGWLAKHPATGKTIAYIAGGNLFGILDLSDPRNPTLLGSWTDDVAGREGYAGSFHSVFPLPELRDGRHYTLLGPEFGSHPTLYPSGILWVLDTTDPAEPVEVAAWTLPHEVEWSGTYMFSNHYFSVQGETAFISMYHGGIWAIDLSPVGNASFVSLKSVGVFLADREPPAPSAQVHRWYPTHEEVIALDDGSLVTFDSNTGLYVLRFDATRPAPSPEPWPIEPVTKRGV